MQIMSDLAANLIDLSEAQRRISASAAASQAVTDPNARPIPTGAQVAADNLAAALAAVAAASPPLAAASSAIHAMASLIVSIRSGDVLYTPAALADGIAAIATAAESVTTDVVTAFRAAVIAENTARATLTELAHANFVRLTAAVGEDGRVSLTAAVPTAAQAAGLYGEDVGMDRFATVRLRSAATGSAAKLYTASGIQVRLGLPAGSDTYLMARLRSSASAESSNQ